MPRDRISQSAVLDGPRVRKPRQRDDDEGYAPRKGPRLGGAPSSPNKPLANVTNTPKRESRLRSPIA